MGVAQDQAELNRVIETARTIPHVMNVISYVKMAGDVQPPMQAGGEEWAAPASNQQPADPQDVPAESYDWGE